MLSITFVVITLLTMVLFYFGTGQNRLVLIFSAFWLFVSGGIAYTGYFEDTTATPPRFLPVMLAAAGLSVFFYKKVSQSRLNHNFLVAIHIVRLPVELVLYQLFLLNQVPVLMTFKGWNFDIVMGVSAICIFCYMVLAKRTLPGYFMKLWNIAGMILLTTIVAISILSSPLPIQQLAFDQPNVAVMQFPYVFLPAYIVPVVFVSHILSFQLSSVTE